MTTAESTPDSDLQAVRRILLDLLSEYQNLAKPANPELLKLHIEAYEDKVLALINAADPNPTPKNTLREDIQSLLHISGHIDQWNAKSGKHYEYWRYTSAQLNSITDEILTLIQAHPKKI